MSRNKEISGYRLVVRTRGFHPRNRGSIPRSRTNRNCSKNPHLEDFFDGLNSGKKHRRKVCAYLFFHTQFFIKKLCQKQDELILVFLFVMLNCLGV